MSNQEIVERIALYLAKTDIHMFSIILQENKKLLTDASFRKFFDSLLQSFPIGQYIIEYTESSDHRFKDMILEEVIDYIQSDKEYLLYKDQKEVQEKIGSLEMELNYYYTRKYVTEQSPAYVTEVTRLVKMNELTSELLQFNHQLSKLELLLGEWPVGFQGLLDQKERFTLDNLLPAPESIEGNCNSDHLEEAENTKTYVDKTKLYEFRRKLIGGFVMGAAYDGSNIFVKETDVKRMGLENGDKLAVKPFGQEYMYDYHIVEKSKNPTTDRVQVDFCFVEEINGQFCVQKRYAGSEIVPINIGNDNIVLYLGEQDVINKRIQDGDLINVAFYEGNTDHVRVLWKHSVKKNIQEE
ncbi:hypothetical protein ABND85_20695 [Paenibacillus larvae]